MKCMYSLAWGGGPRRPDVLNRDVAPSLAIEDGTHEHDAAAI